MLFISIDAFEVLINFTRDHEDWELDEYILILVTSGFLAHWYSYRRYKEMSILQKKFQNFSTLLEEELMHEIEKSNQLLKNRNTELEKKISMSVQKIRKQDSILNQQSKMASMGEMLESIAHQWKQPLSVISITASGLKFNQKHEVSTKEEIIESCDTICTNTNYLSQTIDDFKNFFKKDKYKRYFNMNDIVKDTFRLLKPNFNNQSIDFFDEIEAISYNGHYNELIQAFINILNNAKDELIKKNGARFIFIDVYTENKDVIIKIKDNAGGIPKELLSSVFDPYVSTKKDSGGTGIGLYMSKRIIKDTFKGTIHVENVQYSFKEKEYIGAEFTISLPS